MKQRKSIKIKELEKLISSWERWADARIEEHKQEKNWDNYYSAAGLYTAAEDLRDVIKQGYYGE